MDYSVEKIKGKNLVDEFLATQKRVHELKNEITFATRKWFENNKKSFDADTYYGGEWGGGLKTIVLFG